MPDSSRFPIIVNPPVPPDKALELTKAIGKTIASVEFGQEEPISGGHGSEAVAIYFTDGTSMAIVTGSNAGSSIDILTKADDVAVALTVVWKGDSEWKEFDEVIGM